MRPVSQGIYPRRHRPRSSSAIHTRALARQRRGFRTQRARSPGQPPHQACARSACAPSECFAMGCNMFFAAFQGEHESGLRSHSWRSRGPSFLRPDTPPRKAVIRGRPPPLTPRRRWGSSVTGAAAAVHLPCAAPLPGGYVGLPALRAGPAFLAQSVVR